MAFRADASTEGLTRTSGLPSSTAFTIAGWFRKRGAGDGTWECIFGLIASGGSAWQILYKRISGSDFVRIHGASGDASLGITLSNDIWYYCAIGCNGTGSSALTGWVITTGGTVYTASVTGTSFTPSEMSLLKNSVWTEWVNGAVANAMVWSAKLTTAELQQQMWSSVPVVQQASIHLWTPLWTTSHLNDYSGNGRSWISMGGTPVTEDHPPISWNAPVSWILGQAAGGGTQYDVDFSLPTSLLFGAASQSVGSAIMTLDHLTSILSAAGAISAGSLGEGVNVLIPLAGNASVNAAFSPDAVITLSQSADVVALSGLLFDAIAIVSMNGEVTAGGTVNVSVDLGVGGSMIVSATSVAGGEFSIQILSSTLQSGISVSDAGILLTAIESILQDGVISAGGTIDVSVTLDASVGILFAGNASANGTIPTNVITDIISSASAVSFADHPVNVFVEIVHDGNLIVVTVTPITRVYPVNAEDRIRIINSENRTYVINYEARSHAINQ